MSMNSKNCLSVDTCRNVECPLVKLVGVVLEVECQLCIVTSSVNL